MKKVIILAIILLTTIIEISCKEYRIAKDNTIWYSDELEIYIYNGSSSFPWINSPGIIKKINNGIIVGCKLNSYSVSFDISLDYDVNTPKEYFSSDQYIPYRFENTEMIIDFTNIEMSFFEKKEMILQQKPLDTSVIPLSVRHMNHITLTSLDGTRIINKYDNIVTVNDEEMHYRFQLNRDLTFIFVVYSIPLKDDNTLNYNEESYIYDFDLVSTGYAIIEDNIYTLIFEKDLLFKNTLDGIQYTAR